MQQPEGSKRGYLNEDFRLFHIRDRRELAFNYHYHEFDKIVVFLAGCVHYIMEGKSYSLKPWDVLLVRHNQLHRPIIDPREDYERIVIWVNTDYLRSHSGDGCDLMECFTLAKRRGFSLIRPAAKDRHRIMQLLLDAEEARKSTDFAQDLLSRTYFLQFMILLNRIALQDDTAADREACKSDPRFDRIIAHINEHLDEDLSLDSLSARFYVSKSHLMHRFKEMTGYTAHSYIMQKRLFRAAERIRAGTPVLLASQQCGFGDYSAFLRAFKKTFGIKPSDISTEIEQH